MHVLFRDLAHFVQPYWILACKVYHYGLSDFYHYRKDDTWCGLNKRSHV